MFIITHDDCMQSVHATENDAADALQFLCLKLNLKQEEKKDWKITKFIDNDDYNKTALEFLLKTETQIQVTFDHYGVYFPEDKEGRDIYTITISRLSRSFTFKFGQSIAHSGRYVKYGNVIRGAVHTKKEIPTQERCYSMWNLNEDFRTPRAYDILACLEKYEPESFEDFCGEFGYDADSRKAEKIYKEVKEQAKNVKIIWNDEEIAELQEIQ